MKTQERLNQLIYRIKMYITDEEDVLSELRDLLHDFDGVDGDGNYREKIENSIEWVKCSSNLRNQAPRTPEPFCSRT